jgi:hypothetical protein
MNTRHLILPIACLGLVLTACRHATPERNSQAVSSLQPRNVVATDQPTSLIELTGAHDSVCGRWRVVVSSDHAALHVSRLSARGTVTISPQDWRASKAAFVFVEGDQRVWAYDGRHDLLMLAATADTLISYGPGQFPCEIPDDVASRLPPDVRKRSRER